MELERLRKTLIRHEALKLKPYRCSAGKLTIGVGRNIEDRGISKAEALYLLDNDIRECLAQLQTTFPWFHDLDPVRQEILVNMCFNMGMKTLQEFDQTLAAIKSGDYELAATLMTKSKWAKQVGARATELIGAMRSGKFIQVVA